MQEVLSVPNEVAAELAGIGDGVLNTLRDRLRCTLTDDPAAELEGLFALTVGRPIG